MKSFNVLDRHIDLHHNYLLEASAGTGKTFSIENIVVRLLIEKNPRLQTPLLLEQILVVTYTKKATKDLKLRIRKNIESVITILNLWELTREIDNAIPDYLLVYIEKGSEAVQEVKKCLEQALFCFDQSQIFTIHAFCSKMLKENIFEGNVGLTMLGADKESLNSIIYQVIKDFLRTGIDSENYGQPQLNVLLKKNFKIEDLIADIAYQIQRGLDIRPGLTYKELLLRFCSVMQELKQKEYNAQNIVNDYIKKASFYNKTCLHGEIKQEYLKKITLFSTLFDKLNYSEMDFEMLLEEGLFVLEAFDSNQKNKKKSNFPQPVLEYPLFHEEIEILLKPIIEEALHYPSILAKMACECHAKVKKYFSEEELLSYDDLLKSTMDALKNSQFVDKIRNRYKATIIDEFQDTDPVQWNIFSKLFIEDNQWGSIYLVGDPKQSIYAFRQADIYTYLKAAEQIGQHNVVTLDTNFRSQPVLVNALNLLFSEAKKLFHLPRIDHEIPFQNVKSSERTTQKQFSDGIGCVHYFLAKKEGKIKVDEELLFPAIAKEIQKLVNDENIQYKQIAILIATHRQGSEFAVYLKKLKIPYILQKGGNIVNSLALQSLREVFSAVLQPRNESSFRIALGGKIIGWNHEQIYNLHNEFQGGIRLKFNLLKKTFVQEGFAAFYQMLMQSGWHDDQLSIAEKLLLQEGGDEFYHDLQQIAEILIEYQSATHALPEAVLAYLDEFSKMELNEHSCLNRRQDPDQNAIQILTLHSSKGLEFDVVFAIGLAERSSKVNPIIPHYDQNIPILTPVVDTNSEIFQSYCRESDAEKMRQLYVGMTRAKYRLYIPIIVEKKKPEYGQASPMELFISRLDQPWDEDITLYERLNNDYLENLEKYLDTISLKGDITYSRVVKDVLPQVQDISFLDSIILPPKAVHIPGNDAYIQSYTSLSKTSENSPKFGIPHNYLEDCKSQHSLPAGNEVGNMFHKILETIPFNISKKEIENYLFSFIENSPLKPWVLVLRDMIYNALNVKMTINDVSFSLADVTSDKCYREMEFLYPIENVDCLKMKNCSPGYLKGVIDLIFEYQGKYYLLDWKSNWLGPNGQFYQQQYLDTAMLDNDYVLQADLYQEAFKRYLQLFYSSPFEELFGGVIYLFLRGLDLSSDSGNGIYVIQNSPLQVATW